MLTKSIQLAFKNETHCLVLQKVLNVSQASYSTLISLALHMNKIYSDIFPPFFAEQSDKQDLTRKKSNFQPWSDYLASILQKGYAYKDKQGEMYMICQVPKKYFQVLKQKHSATFLQSTISQETLLKSIKLQIGTIFNIQTNDTNSKKIGVINFACSQLRTDLYHPKINIPALVEGIWFDNESWKTYQVLKGNFPTEQEFFELDVVILSGSSLSVNQNSPPIEKFISLLHNGFVVNQNLKIVGFCFGHQSIAKMFGGRVEKQNWIGGIQTIKFNDYILKQTNFMKSIMKNDEKEIYMCQYHSDYVVKIPDNLQILACSQSCEVQSLKSKDNRILSFQFHPEYTSLYVQMFEKNFKDYLKKQNCSTGFKESKKNIEMNLEDHEESVFIIRKCIKQFLYC